MKIIRGAIRKAMGNGDPMQKINYQISLYPPHANYRSIGVGFSTGPGSFILGRGRGLQRGFLSDKSPITEKVVDFFFADTRSYDVSYINFNPVNTRKFRLMGPELGWL